MKKFLITALLAATSTSSLLAQKEVRAFIMTPKDTFGGLIKSANEKKFIWRESEQTTRSQSQSIATSTVYFFQPPELTEALELYKSRKYQEAAEKLSAVAASYKKIEGMKGNPSSLAYFYQMECYRKLENLEKLSELSGKFRPQFLLREDFKTQQEIYSVFWEAVRTKGWDRIVSIANDDKWRKRKLPGNLRAQIAYCEGLAHEGLKQPIKALNAYNNAFVADFAASEEITRKSATNCLRIIYDHPDVKTTIKLYPTDDYSDNMNGALLIKEGIGLLKLWDQILGAGQPAPKKYQTLLKYPPKKS